MALASVTETRNPDSNYRQINDALDAIYHAKSIVDCLTDSEHIDSGSAVPGALSAVLHLLHAAQKALESKEA